MHVHMHMHTHASWHAHARTHTHRPKVAVTDTLPAARPPDSRLLPPVPQRAGARSVAVSNTGASVVSEFGLQVSV